MKNKNKRQCVLRLNLVRVVIISKSLINPMITSILYCTLYSVLTVLYRYTVLYYTVLHRTVPYRTIPCRTVPYRTVPTVPYYTVPYYTILYYTILYRTVPYRTVLSGLSNRKNKPEYGIKKSF